MRSEGPVVPLVGIGTDVHQAAPAHVRLAPHTRGFLRRGLRTGDSEGMREIHEELINRFLRGH